MTAYERLRACVAAIRQKTDFVPRTALILGSGLGGFGERLSLEAAVEYGELPGFPVSTVPGHQGRFLFGWVGPEPVVVMQGRVQMCIRDSLDNVVYRLGFATTRRDARQLVTHGHFTVNGQKVDIPSYLVKPGDVIEVKASSRSSVKFSKLVGEDAPLVTIPQWLEREKNALKGTVVQMPVREDIDLPVEEHLIVELYSK